MKYIFSLLIVISLFITGCSSNKTLSHDNNSDEAAVAPGQCRLEAQLIKIDRTLYGESDSDPCSKTPCQAWIKIIKIIGYGAGTGSLSPGDTLKTKFAFTLVPADKNNFPTLKEELPGLTVGSIFQSDVQLVPAYPAADGKERTYLIYGYKKIQ